MSNTVVLKRHKNHKHQDRYHHGDLRRALIDAGLQMLEFHGTEGLSLRRLAKALNVSQTAIYSHFKNKTELLAALAEIGFQQLAFQMLESITDPADPQQRILDLSVAYIGFALKNRAVFRLMFGAELADMKKFPTLAMTAGKSYALFSAAVTDALKHNPDAPKRTATNALWSLVHGTAVLAVDGKLAAPDKDQLSAFVTEQLSPLISAFS
ncbi:MAG: TetR/AcrR family transcriptional regulator [Micavibrio sp.]|nr:MAG: TetR/AcrR family transcriptional regulator [Micavibrio sp.]